ncbi:MAG: hypothetical protein WD179_02495 [Actinomycetota bacterium]|jgi:hypothetical protein
MNCNHCGGNDCAVVSFNAADEAKYHYCRYCEQGWWESRGSKLAVAEILAVAPTIKPERSRR